MFELLCVNMTFFSHLGKFQEELCKRFFFSSNSPSGAFAVGGRLCLKIRGTVLWPSVFEWYLIQEAQMFKLPFSGAKRSYLKNK